jgi:glycine hydroxymethyltransferase
MDTSQGVMPAKTAELLDRIGAELSNRAPREIAWRVRELVTEHDDWRRQCLNLLPAENTSSVGSRALRSSYLGTRATEGFPGDKEIPDGHDRQIDQIEAILIELCKRLFRCRFVEWRTTSTTMANAVALFALTEPGDLIMSQTMLGGANWNYNEMAIPRLRGLRVEGIPPGPDFGIDPDKLRPLARRLMPKFFVLGGTKILFPYPLAELRAIADEVGARILYDAAHVSLLISAGMFQDPLREGADILATGTHKIMSGPIGGLSVMNDEYIAQKMLELTFPPFLQTHDQTHYAATAYAFAEMLEHGPAYARQIVANARALAAALDREGFAVLARARGYTMTHQVLVDLRETGAERVALACQEANILIATTSLPDGKGGQARTGSRISVQEVTRQGMREAEMDRIATMIGQAARAERPSEALRREVNELVSGFQRVEFSFDDLTD